MNQIKTQTIEKFLEEVASKAPTPGGGAVSAVTAATAAALVEMVCNLTKNEELMTSSKKDDISVSDTVITKNLTRAKKLRQKLLELADEDAAAFEAVMAAFKLKDPGRKEKIQAAFKRAAETPLKIAKLAHEINLLAKEVLRLGNKNAASDAKTAIYLSDAAKKSAIANVEINLGYIKDPKFVDRLKREVAALR